MFCTCGHTDGDPQYLGSSACTVESTEGPCSKEQLDEFRKFFNAWINRKGE